MPTNNKIIGYKPIYASSGGMSTCEGLSCSVCKKVISGYRC